MGRVAGWRFTTIQTFIYYHVCLLWEIKFEI